MHLHDLLGMDDRLLEAKAAKIAWSCSTSTASYRRKVVSTPSHREQTLTRTASHGLGPAGRPDCRTVVRAPVGNHAAPAAQLGIALVRQVPNKLDAYDQISELGLTDPQVAYMGDDIVDLAVLGRVGLSTAPADAVAEVRARVDWVSTRTGGDGAARELLEMILRAQGRWESLVAAYADEGRSVQS